METRSRMRKNKQQESQNSIRQAHVVLKRLSSAELERHGIKVSEKFFNEQENEFSG